MAPCSFEITDPEYPLSIRDFPRMIRSEDSLDFPAIERCQNVVVRTKQVFDTFEVFESFIRKFKTVRFNYRRYLLISDHNHDVFKCSVFNKDNNEPKCINEKLLKFVHDFLLMKCDNQLSDDNKVIGRQGKCSFFTYTIGDFGKISWLFLDDWYWHNKSFVHNRNLYPRRFSRNEEKVEVNDFKSLNAGGTDYLPYSHIESRMGIEMKAIIEYAEMFNVSMQFYNDEEYWGSINENWTGPGVLGGVVSDKYDIGFSALFILPDRILYSDFSTPTAFSRVSCVVPAPILVESWFMPVRALTSYIWIALILFFLMVATILRTIKIYLFHIDESLKYVQTLTTFAIFIMQPLAITQMPEKFALRLLYTMAFLLTLLIMNAYNSRFSSILVVPSYEGHIETVEDLAERGILWGEMAIDWVLPLKVDERPIYHIAYRNFREADEETLRDYSMSYDFAFGTERLITGFYAVGAYLKEDVINHYRVMKEDLYRQYTNFQMRKHSVWLPSIDSFLLQAWEFGLLYHWENQAVIHHVNYKIQMALMYPPKEEYIITLQMVQVKGSFMFWGFGLAISTITFLVELYRYKSSCKKQKSDQCIQKESFRKFKITEKERNVITISLLSKNVKLPSYKK